MVTIVATVVGHGIVMGSCFLQVESTKDASSTKAEEADLSKSKLAEVSSERMPLNKDTLAFHAWTHSKPACSSQHIHGIETVSVCFEPQTLEVKDRVESDHIELYTFFE